ncbi:MAG: DUF2125 domain-containing protein [Celeribacter sp.]|jgi:hypothetical protein
MRKLTVLVIVLAALWSGYWVLGKTALQRGLAQIESSAQGGIDLSWTDATVRGYPNRFDTTLDGVQVKDSAGHWTWEAPFFQIMALSYKPHHLIAVWPDTQRVIVPGQALTLTSDAMRGSAVFEPETDLTLNRAQLVVDAPRVTSDLDWTVSADRALLAARPAMGEDDARIRDVALELDALSLPPQVTALLGGADLPRRIETLSADMEITFDQPWTRHSLQGPVPQAQRITLRDATLNWGDVQITGTGDIDIRDDGRPEGELDLSAKGWRKLLDIATQAGLLPADQARTIASAAGFFAGGSERLSLPLSFRNGRTYLGPVPLGPAPILRQP